MHVRYLVLLVLLLASCSEPAQTIPDEVYDLREVGVNVIGIEKSYTEMVVLYEPTGEEEDMILDVGIIAGYMYQSNSFDKLKIIAERQENEVFSIIIDRDDIEAYTNNNIDSDEFRERWVLE